MNKSVTSQNALIAYHVNKTSPRDI